MQLINFSHTISFQNTQQFVNTDHLQRMTWKLLHAFVVSCLQKSDLFREKEFIFAAFWLRSTALCVQTRQLFRCSYYSILCLKYFSKLMFAFLCALQYETKHVAMSIQSSQPVQMSIQSSQPVQMSSSKL